MCDRRGGKLPDGTIVAHATVLRIRMLHNRLCFIDHLSIKVLLINYNDKNIGLADKHNKVWYIEIKYQTWWWMRKENRENLDEEIIDRYHSFKLDHNACLGRSDICKI